MLKTVLLTGFGPFPGVPLNASADLVKRLAASARRRWPDVAFRTAILPTEWTRGPQSARLAIAKTSPSLILHFGVSTRAHGFVIETRAANSCVCTADGAGHLPPLTHLETDGPHLRHVTLPVARIVAGLHSASLPVATSNDAGSYICNAVLYQSLGLINPETMTGFIHIPTGSRPALTVGQALTGSLEIIAACLEPAT